MRNSKEGLLIKYLVSFVFWFLFLYVVFAFPPQGLVLPLFFLLLFLMIFFSVRIFSRFGLTLSLGITGYLLLRFLHMDNQLNLVLLIALMVTIGIYQSK